MDTRKLATAEAIGAPELGKCRVVNAVTGKPVAGCHTGSHGDSLTEQATAAEMVRRWNAYPELVLRLQELSAAVNELLLHSRGERGEWADPLGGSELAATEARALLATLNP